LREQKPVQYSEWALVYQLFQCFVALCTLSAFPVGYILVK
jgi:hypothetical protein